MVPCSTARSPSTRAAYGLGTASSWGAKASRSAGRRNGIDDLGSELDPGGNTLSNVFGEIVTDQEVGLIVRSGAGNPDGGDDTIDVIEARGNTWVGGVQGADPDGTYPEHYVIRGRNDRNVWAANSEVRVGRVSKGQP